MRINSGVNTAATSFPSEDPTAGQNPAAPAETPQQANVISPATVEKGKNLEGQLDAFMFRSHLGAAHNEVASAATGASSTGALASSPPQSFLGMRLGVNKYGEEVRVTKEVGSPQGYEDRLQAISVARMNGIDPAAVVQSTDGKWHAVQTNANFAGGLQAAADTPTLAVEGLPSSRSINEVRDKVRDLRAELKQVNKEIGEATRDGRPLSPDLRQRIDRLSEELPHAEKLLGSLVFGVPENEIQLNRSMDQDKPDVINLDQRDKMPGAGVEHFENGDLNGRPTFAISIDKLEKPAEAAGTLFHEISHMQDAKLAQSWLGKFRETNTKFDSSPQGLKDFQSWVKTAQGGKALQSWLAQQPGLSKADAEVVEDAAAHANVSTEARAYIHSAITAMRSGDFDALKDQFKSYALAVKKGQTANPLDQSATMKQLTQELRTAFKQMPKDVQDQFRSAVAAAKAVNPDAWISKLDFSK